MERTSKEEVNIPSIKEIRLERRRLARQNRKRRIFFNTTITWDGTNRTGVLTSLTGNQEDGKITFAPNDDKSELVTNVVNKKGSTLPSTYGYRYNNLLRCWCYLNGWSSSSSYHKETC